jgi:N6-L-threonylcarbamoyladenine synthase
MLIDVEGPGRYRVVGRTVDDAAGEAFDKVAVLLGLGFPGGPAIDRAAEAYLAAGGAPSIRFPRGRVDGRPLDFSFAGLKTAVLYHVRDHGGDAGEIAAAFREAVVEALVERTVPAARAAGRGTVVLTGGVAANRLLRARLAEACAAAGLRLVVPRVAYCTDNAAMIGAAALARGLPAGAPVARPRWSLTDVPRS